uniref:Snake toxin/toxin-like domain-containing protein n=1 Tax=Neogobius melanostomus TaxID=47308 RepID=A0A8C6TYK6_9GOBI
MLRAVTCALLLSLVFSPGDALKCYQCTSRSSDLCTNTVVQTCSITENACGAVIVAQPVQFSLRACMNMAVCQGWISTPGAYAICCSTDLCN